MSRIVRLAALSISLVAFAGCKKDDAVKESLDLLAKHGKEITTKVTGASDKKAGVADAQKYLDANKDDIVKRMKEMSELRGFQLSEDMTSKMAEGIIEATFMCTKLQTEIMAETMEDKDLDTAVDKLCADWDAAVKI